MSLFAAFALVAAARAATAPSDVDLTIRGASAPDRAEVVDALGVRGVEVDAESRTHALVDCSETCRVRITGASGASHTEVSLERGADEPLARAVALAVASALEDVRGPPRGAPTVALGLETSALPRVSLAADFHVPVGRFDWSVGPLLALSTAHYRGGGDGCCAAAWAGSLLAANSAFAMRIGQSWTVRPSLGLRVGYGTPVFTTRQGIIAGTSRFDAELTPAVAVRMPSGHGLRAAAVIPTGSAERFTADTVERWPLRPTIEFALVAELR